MDAPNATAETKARAAAGHFAHRDGDCFGQDRRTSRTARGQFDAACVHPFSADADAHRNRDPNDYSFRIPSCAFGTGSAQS
jgi:hypothetical protein